jgi:hypothetical protein
LLLEVQLKTQVLRTGLSVRRLSHKKRKRGNDLFYTKNALKISCQEIKKQKKIKKFDLPSKTTKIRGTGVVTRGVSIQNQ